MATKDYVPVGMQQGFDVTEWLLSRLTNFLYPVHERSNCFSDL